jgi:CDP-diacylglycerol--glycerol-3-phosphate 3-phosphatidyltransferase
VDYNAVGQVLMYLSTLFSLWSGGGYFKAFLSMLAKRGAGRQGSVPSI